MHQENLALSDCYIKENPHVYDKCASEYVYYHNSHLGTPQLLTDQNQQIVWQASYNPFGEANIAVEQVVNNLRFPGQYFDQETGLHQNWFRDYDPSLGRYAQSDPIGLDGGFNTYLYVDASPITLIDPNGLSATAVLPLAGEGTSLCASNPIACGVVVAGVGGYAAGTLIYPSIAMPLGDLIDSICLNNPTAEECDKAWEEARRRCRQLIWEQKQQDMGRKKKRSVKGVTGGYDDVEECARGLVPEKCGGNQKDYGKPKKPKRFKF